MDSWKIPRLSPVLQDNIFNTFSSPGKTSSIFPELLKTSRTLYKPWGTYLCSFSHDESSSIGTKVHFHTKWNILHSTRRMLAALRVNWVVSHSTRRSSERGRRMNQMGGKASFKQYACPNYDGTHLLHHQWSQFPVSCFEDIIHLYRDALIQTSNYHQVQSEADKQHVSSFHLYALKY